MYPEKTSDEGGISREKEHQLALVDFLQPLTQEELRDLAMRTADVRLDAGQNLYTPRYSHRMLFMVLAGRVRIYEVVAGREFTFMVAGAGEFFGEMALGNGQGLGTYAQALEKSHICIMRNDVFEELVMRRPAVGLEMVRLLNDRLVQFGNRMLDVGMKEVLARLAGLIINLAESEGMVNSEQTRIPTRYTHRQLGTMIGANREAVTNALLSLRSSGAIKILHRHIYVVDSESLKQIARD